MHSFIGLSAVLAVVPFVRGHGTVTDPPARAPGTAFKAACGEQVFNNQKGDNKGNVQGELQIAMNQKDYNAAQCNLFMCKGFMFQDNMANVQTYTANQVVPIKVAITAPHTGTANVSIVDTKSNAVIGQPLISFNDYASNAHAIPANNTAFSITMPDVSSQCGTAGNCVVQWFWNAQDAKQTYEACIDFTMGGGANKLKKRQQTSSPKQMESMTNGPQTTMSMVVTGVGKTSATSSAAGVKATGKAGANNATMSGESMSMKMSGTAAASATGMISMSGMSGMTGMTGMTGMAGMTSTASSAGAAQTTSSASSLQLSSAPLMALFVASLALLAAF
ncbi:hypothetical protein BT63DRAFT_463633 [Microthyrium microscopicum]|uniref:Chitin-binding type-4 domain-containing protein n=1 Tax=Microthyrium microscopicum TaxID=703497 RepID=A0A6A6U2K9_9PEZI|nr:hypothetical protein BT63DRAFT_463633 [Microthyrium microscopicum]